MGIWITAGLVLCQLIPAIIIILAIRNLRLLNRATNLRVTSLQNAFTQIEEIYKLETRLAEKRKKLENPSTELREFLVDLADEGCGILRIHPGSILIRGMRQ